MDSLLAVTLTANLTFVLLQFLLELTKRDCDPLAVTRSGFRSATAIMAVALVSATAPLAAWQVWAYSHLLWASNRLRVPNESAHTMRLLALATTATLLSFHADHHSRALFQLANNLNLATAIYMRTQPAKQPASRAAIALNSLAVFACLPFIVLYHSKSAILLSFLIFNLNAVL